MATPEGAVKALISRWLHGKGFIKAGSAENKWPENPKGWYYMPVPSPFQVHGIPDFCGIWKGRAFYIEAKGPKGEASENQKRRHEEIRRANGVVWLVAGEDDLSVVDAWLASV